MTDEDLITYFLDDIENHGRSVRTVEAYERVLRRFETHVTSQFGRSPQEATYRDCMAFVHELRSEHAESTVASYASYLNRFYGYLVRVGKHGSNPMDLVLDEMNEGIETNPSRRDISLSEMRSFVSGINHPLEVAVIVTLLKTGIRSGELCNLDLRDLHIDHPAMEWTPRAAIEEKPNSLYISADHQHGRKSDGIVRTESNKRKRSTVVPVDPELKAVIIRWLAIRPDIPSPTIPLFVGTGDQWGCRLTVHMVHHMVEQRARDRGWYKTGGGATENVTPHYFRHFFTTHLRDRTGDRGVVKYLRGDVADDIIETYTHDWNNRVRETYLAHIFSLFSDQIAEDTHAIESPVSAD